MSITDKTRKILWGRSGNLCAFCRRTLVVEASALDPEAIVGDECHIISGAPNGPRHDPAVPREQIDEPDNLILLCRVHHKLVDDQPETFTASALRTLRSNHERWVKERLADTGVPKPVRRVRIAKDIPQHLIRVMSSKMLIDAMAGASFGMYQDHPEDLNDDQLGTVRDFLQNLTDWSDFGLDDAPTRIDAQSGLAEDLKNLEEVGLRVYVAQERQRLEGGVEPPSSIYLLHVRIVRADDPSQIEVPQPTSGSQE